MVTTWLKAGHADGICGMFLVGSGVEDVSVYDGVNAIVILVENDWITLGPPLKEAFSAENLVSPSPQQNTVSPPALNENALPESVTGMVQSTSWKASTLGSPRSQTSMSIESASTVGMQVSTGTKVVFKMWLHSLSE